MTVASTSNRVDYTGNGSTTVFSFSFRIFDNADLVVTKADADGVETTLVLDTDYTVTGAGSYSGGSITLGTALTSGHALTIQRVLDITQETDLRNQGQFFAETHEDVFDRLVMINQQLQEQIDRAAKLPVTNTTDAEELTADITVLANKLTELTAIYNALSDIQTVADDLNEGTSEIEVVAGSITNVNNVGNNISNVGTVAGISSNVTTVAGIAANVTTVAGISSAVSGVASISSAVSAVNSNASNINAVNSNATNINAVAANETNIDAVAGNETNIDTVAGINANVTTVAGISSAVSAVAADATDIGTVAANIADVNTVADNIADVNTAATNIAAIIDAPNQATAASNSAIAAAASAAAAAASYDSFDDRYLGSKSSDPTVDNDGNPLVTGALYYSSTEQAMKVYDGATWILASSAGAASMNVFKFVATAGQTTFTGAASVGGTLSYTSGNIIVFMNGAALDAADYTATDGTSVVLGAAASLNDELVIVAFKSFTVADTYSQSAADAEFLRKAGEDGVTVSSGNIEVTGKVTAAKGSSNGITIGDVSTNSNSVLRMQGTSAGKNWQIANNLNVAGLEFTPSTSDGGTTYTTPSAAMLSNGNFQFNSGYGSVATAYGCRAWVNFNGSTSGPSIRGSGNVTSITDNGVGDYTVNFTTALPDGNYSIVATCQPNSGNAQFAEVKYGVTPSTSAFTVRSWSYAGTLQDVTSVYISVFR